MNVTTACQCIITLTLFGISVPIHMPATAASGSVAQASMSSGTPETKTPPTAGSANPNATTRGATRPGKTGEAPRMPPNRTQEVEDRVRSGQMDQPIAQGEISERLNQLEAGSKSLSDSAATHSSR